MNANELTKGATPLKQVWPGKVHFYRHKEVLKWPVRVHCGDWVEEYRSDLVTNDLSTVPEKDRCKKCWRRRVDTDRARLEEIEDLCNAAGEGGMVPVAAVRTIIESRARRAS